MPRKGADPDVDGDYDPYDSFEEERRVRQRTAPEGPVVRSSRGRPVKIRQYIEDAGSDEDEQQAKSERHASGYNTSNSRPSYADNHYHQSGHTARPKQAKRQRWVPHNPHILGQGFEDDEDSRDVQISDDDESGDEGASRSARRRVSDARIKGSSVPVRDESGKFVGVRPQTAAERRHANVIGRAGGGGGIFKTAAVTVLREEKRLMSTGEIARIALKRGYVKVQGRTPEATMASAMYTDVKRKEDRSTFVRPHEGLFGLREWLEEGVEFKDPVQDKFPEESMHGALRRNRIGSHSAARPASRSSNAGARNRGHQASPAYDQFNSNSPSQTQGASNQGDSIYGKEDFPATMPEGASRNSDEPPLGLPPRLATGLPGLDHKSHHLNGRGYASQHSTPFGSNRGGPSVEIFKSRFADGNSHSGFGPSGKRSMSGTLLPYPTPSRANSAGRNRRKSGPNMASADSGNMLLLLSAVDQSLDRSNSNKLGVLHKPLANLERRQPSGTLRRDAGDERQVSLTVQGFNASRVASLHSIGQSAASAGQSNQVNILNLPLPEANFEQGSLEADEVVPEDADFDPAMVPPTLILAHPQPHATPPPGVEAHLQALDHAFGRTPLPIMGSLSGALPLTFSIPNELPPLTGTDHPETTVSTAVPAPGTTEPGAVTAAPRLPAPSAIRQLGMKPGSAFSAAGSHQLAANAGNPMQDFGVPEEGVKRLPEVEAAVRGMESSLGGRHPKVGKGYLYLSRVYQCVATPEYYQKAQQALHHAYEICFACQV